ncbi:MAG TPA: hypothetical protein VFA20_24585 [Myxococcaceae bacterium]|nr:hypothetical protein [Myxococcaceae bacterium]
MHPARALLLAAGALLLAACPSKPPAAAPDASAPTPDAGAPAPDAGGAPPPLKMEVRYLASDAGMALIAFAPEGGRPLIEPTSELELSTNIGLQNYRIRLFDEVDRAMASDDQMEEPGDRVRYRIQLPAPLKAGHRYALVVDAQTGSAIADSAGRLYPDQRLEFAIAGAREPDAPPKKHKAKPTRKRR